ncbi:DUF4097 family beta strand repeat-containing protein [Ruminococcus sp. Marseille-P6503]|uniref:DUF4097 family beta strand repeat-containing protein n=1 Tax=Ruminococcus sp. Marseille-P6503 TaxID=2364796 RepID=UPI000F5454B9|nr:DUF4097 family beta strand repeat-containing protein [Ruminococcus sp. Marseille-P6503]
MENSRKRRLGIPVILLIAGIVLIALGTLLIKFTDTDKYFAKENINESFSAENIECLNVEAATANFYLESYDGSEIIVEAHDIPQDRYSFECSGNKFSIEYNQAKWYEWYKTFGFGWFEKNYNDSYIKIRVPDKEYAALKLEGGIGEYTVSGLKCINADIDSGIGKNSFTECTISGKLNIDMGIGELILENCSLNQSDIDGGAGQINFSGKILGGLNVDCGIGDSSFKIDGYYSDYDIKTDTGIGEIKIDRGSAGNNGSSLKIPIDINGGMGEVNISFK